MALLCVRVSWICALNSFFIPRHEHGVADPLFSRLFRSKSLVSWGNFYLSISKRSTVGGVVVAIVGGCPDRSRGECIETAAQSKGEPLEVLTRVSYFVSVIDCNRGTYSIQAGSSARR
jgi:hypothetical protein